MARAVRIAAMIVFVLIGAACGADAPEGVVEPKPPTKETCFKYEGIPDTLVRGPLPQPQADRMAGAMKIATEVWQDTISCLYFGSDEIGGKMALGGLAHVLYSANLPEEQARALLAQALAVAKNALDVNNIPFFSGSVEIGGKIAVGKMAETVFAELAKAARPPETP